jgi:myosin-crossreactive antigen
MRPTPAHSICCRSSVAHQCQKTVSDEIHAFNDEHIPESHARLVRGGAKVDISTMGFSNRDRLDLIELMAVSEASLGAKRIEDVFAPSGPISGTCG